MTLRKQALARDMNSRVVLANGAETPSATSDTGTDRERSRERRSPTGAPGGTSRGSIVAHATTSPRVAVGKAVPGGAHA